jgi:hypothetical protein
MAHWVQYTWHVASLSQSWFFCDHAVLATLMPDLERIATEAHSHLPIDSSSSEFVHLSINDVTLDRAQTIWACIWFIRSSQLVTTVPQSRLDLLAHVRKYLALHCDDASIEPAMRATWLVELQLAELVLHNSTLNCQAQQLAEALIASLPQYATSVPDYLLDLWQARALDAEAQAFESISVLYGAFRRCMQGVKLMERWLVKDSALPTGE